jgi:hypothetical protein
MCDVSLRKTSAADILNMAGERLILTARCWTKIIQQLLWRYWVKSLPSVHWNEVRRPRLVVNMNSGGDWCFSFRSAVLSVNWPNTSIWSRGIKDSIPHSCRRQCQTAVSNSTTHPTVSFRKFWHTSHFAQEFIFIYGLYILYVYIYMYTHGNRSEIVTVTHWGMTGLSPIATPPVLSPNSILPPSHCACSPLAMNCFVL